MDIFEKTRELGVMIQESEIMAKVKETEAAQAADEDAQTLMQEFNLKRMNLARDIQQGKIAREEAVVKNNENFDAILEKNENLKNYVEAKKELDALVNQINSILNFYITGEVPGCGGSCSTCSGC